LDGEQQQQHPKFDFCEFGRSLECLWANDDDDDV